MTRVVHVIEVRHAPTPKGPWGEPEVEDTTTDPLATRWTKPELCMLEPHVGEYFQLRTVAYVPRQEGSK
jgi:hypothetical protein